MVDHLDGTEIRIETDSVKEERSITEMECDNDDAAIQYCTKLLQEWNPGKTITVDRVSRYIENVAEITAT